MPSRRTSEDRALLSLRAALILSLATIVAVVAGLLTYLAEASVPTAVLCGGAAWAGSVTLLGRVIEYDEKPRI